MAGAGRASASCWRAHWSLFFLDDQALLGRRGRVTVYTAPLFIAAVAPLFLPESCSRVALAALVPAAAGIVLIAVAGNDGGHVRPLASPPVWAPAPLYAALVIGGKRLRLHLHPVTFAFWIYLSRRSRWHPC